MNKTISESTIDFVAGVGVLVMLVLIGLAFTLCPSVPVDKVIAAQQEASHE